MPLPPPPPSISPAHAHHSSGRYDPEYIHTPNHLNDHIPNTTTTTSNAGSNSKSKDVDSTSKDNDDWPIPQFNLQFQDIAHPGARLFFHCITQPEKEVRDAVMRCFRVLYGNCVDVPRDVKTITIVFRPMEGVAHTFGTKEHKQIHFSLDHIVNTHRNWTNPSTYTSSSYTSSSSLTSSTPPPTTILPTPTPTPIPHNNTPNTPNTNPNTNGNAMMISKDERTTHEIQGVLTHEIVHCYQFNALGTCPGGLIEGIADYVRLRSSLSPPHWSPPSSHKPSSCPSPERGDKWDAGYERTAYFLEWIERRYGEGSVSEVNWWMRERVYHDVDGDKGNDNNNNNNKGKGEGKGKGSVWKAVTGRGVDKLWRIYCEEVCV